MKPDEQNIDLHIHTNASDGTLSPTEIIQEAAEARLKVISICDHDTTDGVSEAMAAQDKYGVTVVPGVEVSATDPKGEAHILGYWVGPPFWNTGYASEAARAVVEAARAAGCQRLTSGVVETNEASAHVLANAGFTETGKGENYGVAVGRMMPMRMFELVFAPVEA